MKQKSITLSEQQIVYLANMIDIHIKDVEKEITSVEREIELFKVSREILDIRKSFVKTSTYRLELLLSIRDKLSL